VTNDRSYYFSFCFCRAVIFKLQSVFVSEQGTGEKNLTLLSANTEKELKSMLDGVQLATEF
jgi:hypothetical protein